MADWRVAEGGDGADPEFPLADQEMSAAEQALLDHRIILMNGKMDHLRSARIAGSLLSLGATGDEPLEIRINAESDSLDVAFALMDTIDSLEAPVHATVVGSVAGTMVGVLAVCRHRRIGALAHVELREPRDEFAGVANQLRQHATNMQERLESFVRRLTQVTGRPFEHVETDLRSGVHLDAAGAIAYGLADEIVGRA